MSRNKYLIRIREDLSMGKLERALDNMESYISLIKDNTEYLNSLYILKARYYYLKNQKYQGLLDESFVGESNIVIANNLLGLIHSLELEQDLELDFSEKDLGKRIAAKLKSIFKSEMGMTPVFKK